MLIFNSVQLEEKALKSKYIINIPSLPKDKNESLNRKESKHTFKEKYIFLDLWFDYLVKGISLLQVWRHNWECVNFLVSILHVFPLGDIPFIRSFRKHPLDSIFVSYPKRYYRYKVK